MKATEEGEVDFNRNKSSDEVKQESGKPEHNPLDLSLIAKSEDGEDTMSDDGKEETSETCEKYGLDEIGEAGRKTGNHLDI